MTHLVFNVPRHSHVTPLLTDLHWLPVIAYIKCKALVLAYQAVKGSAPAYIRPYTPARPFRSTTSEHLVLTHLSLVLFCTLMYVALDKSVCKMYIM